MRKLILAAMVSTLVFGMVGMAEAEMFTESFLGNYNDNTVFSLANGKVSDYYFDLTTSGNLSTNFAQYNGGTKTLPNADADVAGLDLNKYIIDSITLYCTFSDNDTSAEKLTVTVLDNNSVVGNYTGNTTKLNINPGVYLTKSYSLNDFSILNDGKLGVSVVTSGGTNVNVEQVRLDVTAHAAPVPLPATGLLLCTGLIGLISVRRKQTV